MSPERPGGLSVLTLVRDRNALLGRLLDGLDAQTVAPAALVVAWCGGTQDPHDVVRRRARAYPVQVVAVDGPDERIAYSVARNTTAAVAPTEALAFLDADCIPSSTYVEALGSALAQHDALCTGDVLYLPPGVPDDADEPALRAAGRPHPHRLRPPARGVAATDRHELVWGLHMALRRPTLARVGGFDEGYRGYAGEDTDLGVALRGAGVPALLVAGADVFHQHHDTWEPPLQQVAATVANAQRFRDRWGWWPMDGWLSEMAELGVVAWDPGAPTARVVREPTADELAAAHRTTALPFRSDRCAPRGVGATTPASRRRSARPVPTSPRG